VATSYSIRGGAQNMKRRNNRGFGSGVVSGCSWANFIGRGGEVRHQGEVNGGGRWWIFKMTVSKFLSFKKATRGGETEGWGGRGSRRDEEASR
jgi:hypothetical protein